MSRNRFAEFFRLPLSRPVALALVVVATGLIALRAAPGFLPWNVVPLGAFALFCGARLRGWPAFGIPLFVKIVTDVVIYFQFGGLYPMFDPFTYACLFLAIGLGAALLRRTSNGLAVIGVALTSAVAFFLVTNFGSWVAHAMDYPRNFAGLMLAFEKGLPFFRAQIVSEVVAAGVLFEAHAALSRAYSPAEVPAGAEA